MQNTTASTIGDIEKVSEIILKITTIINGIATVVEERSAASYEISSNTAQASQGVAEVKENVPETSPATTSSQSTLESTAIRGRKATKAWPHWLRARKLAKQFKVQALFLLPSDGPILHPDGFSCLIRQSIMTVRQ